MDFLNEVLRFLQDGINWIVTFIQRAWSWAVEQIGAIPWDSLGSLPWWKIIILIATAGGVGWFLYQAGKEIFEAGKGALDALATLLTAFVKTLLPVILAGLIATAGAWIINEVNF